MIVTSFECNLYLIRQYYILFHERLCFKYLRPHKIHTSLYATQTLMIQYILTDYSAKKSLCSQRVTLLKVNFSISAESFMTENRNTFYHLKIPYTKLYELHFIFPLVWEKIILYLSSDRNIAIHVLYNEIRINETLLDLYKFFLVTIKFMKCHIARKIYFLPCGPR